jgi:FSR family fosmidomycin resistance protein-like MFS transporter
VWTIASLKLVNDAYISFPTALMPILAARFALSLTAVGVLTAVLSLSSMLIQPIFGYLADRWRTRFFVVACPALTITTMGLVTLAPTYGAVLALLILGGLGTAAFNPQATSLVRSYAGLRPGVALAMLAAGGQLGRAIGPISITLLVATLGVEAAPLTLLALPFVLFASAVVPRAAIPQPALSGASVSATRRRIAYVGVLCGLVAVRALTLATFSAFLPLLLTRLGFSLPAVGATLSVLQMSGAVGGLIGGFLAHRIGYRNVILLALVTPVLPFWLVTATDGWMLIGLTCLAGVLLMLSVAANLSFALEIWPSRAALVSGIMIGVGWGIGGTFAGAFGAIADAIGLVDALRLAATTLIIGVPLSFLLPGDAGRGGNAASTKAILP